MMTVGEVVTPTNVALSVIIGYLLYKIFGLDSLANRRRDEQQQKREAALGHDRKFTLAELKRFDGTNLSEEHGGEKPIYIAIDGVVFDATEGAAFYGPGKA